METTQNAGLIAPHAVGATAPPTESVSQHNTHQQNTFSSERKHIFPDSHPDSTSYSFATEKSTPYPPDEPYIDFSAEIAKFPKGSFDSADNFYPEGGAQAYLVVFGSLCGMLAALGIMNSIGIIQAYLSANQLKDYDESTISWIFSIYIFLSFFCGLQIGPVFDAKGPTALVLAGSVLIVVGIETLGSCTKYWHFVLSFSVCAGVGTSLIFTPAIASIAHFFARRRATFVGLASTGGSLGGVIYPLMIQALLPRLGWAWTMRVWGFILLVLCTIATLTLRSRLPPSRTGSLRDLLPDVTIFKDGDGALAMTTAGIFFLEWGLFVPLTYVTSYAISYGVDSTFAFQLMAIFNAGSCLGRYFPGIIADRLGRFNTMIVFGVLCMVFSFALWLPARGSVRLLIAFSALFGFSSGSNISLTPICVGQLCDTRQYGRYYATAYTVVSFGTLTGLPIAGAIIQACGGRYFGIVLYTGACYAVAIVCFLYVRTVRKGWKLRVVW